MSIDRRSRGTRGVLVFAMVPNLSLVWDARDLPGSMGQVYGHTFHGDLYCVHD
jgi:hypothetical protein